MYLSLVGHSLRNYVHALNVNVQYVQSSNFLLCSELCADPRNNFITIVILGVLTFGISILIWYIYLKSDNKKGIVNCMYVLINFS